MHGKTKYIAQHIELFRNYTIIINFSIMQYFF